MRRTFSALWKTCLFLLWALTCATANAIEDKPLWEYGIGLGGIHYEQYPASDQFSDFALPFPTFQYRGEILRADDRDGARAYLFKEDHLSLEMAGGVYPALDSSNNRAREGMDNIPWMILLGPQLVQRWSDNWEIKGSVFQAISSDFHLTKTSGFIFEGRVQYRWFPSLNETSFFESGHSVGELSFTVRSASRQLQAVYYDVGESQVRPDRWAYEAREGLLSDELSYYQSFTSGRTSFYLGAAWADYRFSANRASPLRKSDGSLTYFAGLTYVLGESHREAVPVEETEGLLNRNR
jgi:outer membrane scaffolding protein for murein synthesis (MipA/OmpV family)